VLAVLPEYEGRGIGRRLLSHAVEFLRSLGFGEAWLAATSNATSRAHGFYRALGWRPTGAQHESGDEILRLTRENPQKDRHRAKRRLSRTNNVTVLS
jgi:N-acetylglutamate synthase-like GNAT family acetyltransferase